MTAFVMSEQWIGAVGFALIAGEISSITLRLARNTHIFAQMAAGILALARSACQMIMPPNTACSRICSLSLLAARLLFSMVLTTEIVGWRKSQTANASPLCGQARRYLE